MANTLQSKKRIRRNQRQSEINKRRLSQIRTSIKKVETAITAGDKKAATEAFLAAKPEIARGATKGVYHKTTAARKISRLETRINALNS